jgi:elongation factor P
MASTADFRNGLVISYNNDLYTIVEFQHVKPGKGAAFVRTRLKSLTTGKVIPNTFDAGEKINLARVERRPFQYLYKDENGYNFMNQETFDQISVDEKLINAPQFLKEGNMIEIVIHADTDTVLYAELPAFVNLMVTYTEPGLRGDTATNTLKAATVETGATVKVPLFVNEGELIKVDTRTGDYSERVKS